MITRNNRVCAFLLLLVWMCFSSTPFISLELYRSDTESKTAVIGLLKNLSDCQVLIHNNSGLKYEFNKNRVIHFFDDRDLSSSEIHLPVMNWLIKSTRHSLLSTIPVYLFNRILRI